MVVPPTVKTAAKFTLTFLVATLVNTALWSATAGRWLYDCTDAVGLDYLQPGNWVHGQVVVVPRVVHHRPMSEPDIIRAGWSVSGLWALWFSLLFISLGISGWLAFSARLQVPRATLTDQSRV